MVSAEPGESVVEFQASSIVPRIEQVYEEVVSTTVEPHFEQVLKKNSKYRGFEKGIDKKDEINAPDL